MLINTNVNPVIPRSATTNNVDLYPSTKGRCHQELFQDPAITSHHWYIYQHYLNISRSQIPPKQSTIYLLHIIHQFMHSQLPIHPTRTLHGTILYALQHSVMIKFITGQQKNKSCELSTFLQLIWGNWVPLNLKITLVSLYQVKFFNAMSSFKKYEIGF